MCHPIVMQYFHFLDTYWIVEVESYSRVYEIMSTQTQMQHLLYLEEVFII